MSEYSTPLLLGTMTETEPIAVVKKTVDNSTSEVTIADNAETESELVRDWRTCCLSWTGVLLLLVTIFGFVIRVTIRDSSAILGAVYYALPWPVLSLLAFSAGLVYRSLAKRVLSRSMLAAGMVSLAWWCSTTWQISAAGDAGADSATIRVVFWNTCRGFGGWKGLARDLNNEQADIIGLVESGLSHQQIAENWSPHFADRQVHYLGRGMTIITRGKIGSIQDYTLAEGSHAYAVPVELNGSDYLVIICDIRSTPWRSRRQPLQTLSEIVAAHSDQAVILMGDFNTPIDSLHVQSLKEELVNVFEQAGNGLHVTWPLPLPVHALDQIWVNSRFTVSSARLGWSWRSDHRAVVTKLHTRNLTKTP